MYARQHRPGVLTVCCDCCPISTLFFMGMEELLKQLPGLSIEGKSPFYLPDLSLKSSFLF
jgi:hypothetical protein